MLSWDPFVCLSLSTALENKMVLPAPDFPHSQSILLRGSSPSHCSNGPCRNHSPVPGWVMPRHRACVDSGLTGASFSKILRRISPRACMSRSSRSFLRASVTLDNSSRIEFEEPVNAETIVRIRPDLTLSSLVIRSAKLSFEKG